jgi:hypothetical protein
MTLVYWGEVGGNFTFHVSLQAETSMLRKGNISLLMRDICLTALVEMATKFNLISCALCRVRLVTGEEFAFKCT